MKRLSNVSKFLWRRRYVTAAGIGLTAACVFFVAIALADAGNPILGTIHGTIVPDPSGTGVTVYVRGQWNWLTHKSDCNFDRAGAGVGIIWNDPNSPGYTVSKGSITASVGVQSSTDGNAVDQMVHPVDRGNVPQGYTAGTWTSTAQGYTTDTAGDYPQGQQFVDPSPPSPNEYTSWKGGCGREPLSSTGPAGSGGLGTEGIDSACAGGGSCSGHPWGSWGYEKNGGLGYSHHYAQRSDVTTVCANFYDVHGGGKFNSSKFQLVNGAKEITVNQNSDNSIQTNAFNTAQGANCVSFPLATPNIVTSASAATIGQSISDTATLSGGTNPTGTIAFTAYAPKADGSADTTCSTAVYTNTVTVDTGNGSYTSGDFKPSGTAPQIAGTYEWKASYSGDSNNSPASTNCGDPGEQSVVNKHASSVPTGQKVVISDFAKVTSTVGTPTGTVDFQLFTNSTCTGTPLYDSGPVTLVNGLASTNGASTKPPTLNANGAYSWLVSYTPASGSAFSPSSSPCGTERATISGNTPGVDP